MTSASGRSRHRTGWYRATATSRSARILGDLLAAGYPGLFDLELVGPRIDEEGYDAAVPRAVEVLGAMLTELGA